MRRRPDIELIVLARKGSIEAEDRDGVRAHLGERADLPDGVAELGYTADPRSEAVLARVASTVGGRVVSEGDAGRCCGRS